jgi:hypothetical protein
VRMCACVCVCVVCACVFCVRCVRVCACVPALHTQLFSCSPMLASVYVYMLCISDAYHSESSHLREKLLDYVITVLRDDLPRDALRRKCISRLEEFLGDSKFSCCAEYVRVLCVKRAVTHIFFFSLFSSPDV